MADVSVYGLTRFTALAAGDILPGVDISDPTQSAHGSLDSITVTNFFGTIPVDVIVKGGNVTTIQAATFAQFIQERCEGTIAAPTAVQSGIVCGLFSASAYGTTAYGNIATIRASSTQIQTDTHHGGAWTILTVPNNSTTPTLAVTIDQDQSVAVSSASSFALAVGLAGATNPAFRVNASVGSQAAGLMVAGAVAAGTVAVSVISSGADASLSVDAKGSGTITFGGTSTGNIIASRAVAAASSVKSSSATAGIGYATGAGGTIAQGSGSGKATGVTLNTVSGTITMDGAALNAGVIVSFVFTNSAMAAGDVMILNHVSAGTPGSYLLNAACGAGAGTVYVRNNTAGNLSEAIVIGFALIKAVTA